MTRPLRAAAPGTPVNIHPKPTTMKSCNNNMKDIIRAGHAIGGVEITAQEMRIWLLALEGVEEKKLAEAFADHFKFQPTAPRLHDIFKGLTVPTPSTAHKILADCMRRNNVTLEQLRGPDRKRPLVTHRQKCMYDMKQHTSMSLPQIGRIFNRDHTTVMHAIRVVEARGENQ